MASTALTRLANSRGSTTRGTRIGRPDQVFRKQPSLNARTVSGKRFKPPEGAVGSVGFGGVFKLTGAGYKPYGVNAGIKSPFPNPKKFKTVTNVIPRKSKIKQFSKNANLTAAANITPILNKIANWAAAPSSQGMRLTNGKVLAGRVGLGVGVVGAFALAGGAGYAAQRATPSLRSIKRRQKITKANKKAALKAKKIEAKKTLRANKAVKPMNGASGRGVAKGKVGQSGGGRKNFRPRRDGNGKFAGSY
jgi:hypothetical protein